MLIQSLLAMKSRHALVRDTYRKNLNRFRGFTVFCEQRAIEISPDQKPLLLNCFKLWDLLIDQRAIRFEYLIKSKSLDCSIFKSLDEIDERLDKDWDLTEEDALKKSNERYTSICQEMVDIKSKWDSDSLTAPLKTFEQDPRYRAAREANADRIQQLQSRIAPK
jgi:hypothetical protein